MRSFQAIGTLILGIALVTLVSGCGSSNNDQGTTFTHLGYFSELPDDACGTIPAGISGLSLPISVIQGEGTGSEAFGGAASIANIGVQNNLAGQTVRVRRIYYDYVLQGASSQPPSTSAPLSLLLGPSGGGTQGQTQQESTEEEISTSLPDGLQTLCNKGYAQVITVPNDVLEWMNFNRNSLPELPFTLEVTSTIEGITSAGDVYRTNGASVFIVFEPDNTINPGTSAS